MKELFVDLDKKTYKIYFDVTFENLCKKISDVGNYKKVLIVTDSNVEKLYLDEVKEQLLKGGFDVSAISFEAGEQNKHMDTILSICKACIKHSMDRKSLIVALGGGVVGDMAGFAASIFMRGIDFIQVPTTLLSQSDSSVGGKTGIDFMGAKNILGAFHQPKLVYINTSTLKTLPKREFISGMGEVIKHGMIRNKEFFNYLADNFDEISKVDDKTMLDVVYTNCKIKADVVSKDEFENGVRADLNFGHTIGHAIESYMDFSLSHGECVGLGMLACCFISVLKNKLTNCELESLKNVLGLYGFRVKIPIADKNAIKELMKKDKKKANDKQKFILAEKIGFVYQSMDVTEEEIDKAIEYICE